MLIWTVGWPGTSHECGGVASALEVDYPAAARHVKRLVDLDILQEITGKKRNRLFAARRIIAAVEGPGDEGE
ncbi:MAG: hypothetical protein ABIK79_09490 [Chloroflexota bacterium]